MKKMYFVHTGACRSWELSQPLPPGGVYNLGRMKQEMAVSEAGYDASVRSMAFCSPLIQSFHAATILCPHDPIVALPELQNFNQPVMDTHVSILEKMMGICLHQRRQIAVVVCHDPYPPLFAQAAVEKVMIHTPQKAPGPISVHVGGYSVDMETGVIAKVMSW
jgi:hypothetical protein